MKSPIPKKLEALVLQELRNHAWNIGVSHYSGDILYMEDDATKDEDDSQTIATIDVDRRYLKATIKIFPYAIREWKQVGDDFIKNAIAHEVAHIATSHLHWLAVSVYKDSGEMKDAWETLTQVVANLSLKIEKLEQRKSK